MEIKKLPASEGWGILKTAWDITRGNWGGFFVFGLVILAVSAGVSMVPLIGGPVGQIVGQFLSLGIFLVVREYRRSGRFQPDLVIQGFSNPDYFKRLVPLALVWGVNGVLAGALSAGVQAKTLGLSSILGMTIASFCIALFTWMAAPLICVRGMKFGEALGATFSIGMRNWLSLTILCLIPLTYCLVVSLPLLIYFAVAVGFPPSNTPNPMMVFLFTGIMLLAMGVAGIALLPAYIATKYSIYEKLFGRDAEAPTLAPDSSTAARLPTSEHSAPN